jgi:hypothetical protein
VSEATVESKYWPPTNDTRHVVIFQHRDGRRVRYVRGWMAFCGEARELSAKLHDRFGTAGGAEPAEAFPGEDICQGCVGVMGRWNEDANGEREPDGGWWSTSPDFKTGVRSNYCPACRDREAALVRYAYERDLRILGVATAVRQEASS